jgi:hypothetical protein
MEDVNAARLAAERDVDADMNGILWFGAGCLLSWVGILLGYLIEPSPPAARLIGKPPGYAEIYSNEYKSRGKSAQGKMAIIGCLVGGAAWVVLYVVLIAGAMAASESAN